MHTNVAAAFADEDKHEARIAEKHGGRGGEAVECEAPFKIGGLICV